MQRISTAPRVTQSIRPPPLSPPPPTPSYMEGLLCIHGSATTGRSWSRLVAPLRDEFEVATPDRLGCSGDTPWRPRSPASFQEEARHLSTHLFVHPKGVHVLAHSYGAAVALELALRWPHLVRSLTLYEPARFALLFDCAEGADDRNEIVSLGRTVMLCVISGRLRDAASLFVDYWSGPGAFEALDASRRETVVGNMPKVAAEFESAFGDRTPLTRFSELAMPVHLLSGSESPPPVRRIVAILAEVLPNVERVELNGVGHMGPVTHAPRVFAQLPDWLAPLMPCEAS